MYCNECGKEIADNSKFCNFCGAHQKAQENKTLEGNKEATQDEINQEEDKNGLVKFFLVCGITVLILFLIAVVIGLANDNGSGGKSSENEDYSYQSNKKAAKNSDIIISFKRESRILAADDYYMIIQAQEKITGLKLEIDYKTSGGTYIKTETVYVGKVVPGNQYRFELSQNGMDPSYVDETEKFNWRVVAGTIED